MIYLLAMLVMLMGIVGGGTVTLINLFRQESQQTNTTFTRQHLDEVAQTVLENTRTSFDIDGYGFYPPAADKLAGLAYSTMPTWLSLNAHTAQGIPFLYCPFSNVTIGTKAQTVTLPNGSTYTVAKTALYSGGTRNFITVSAAAPSNTPEALAIIVAPVNSAATPPSCLNVDSNGQLPGAYTRIITRQDVWQRQLRRRASRRKNIFGPPAATGDGTGRNPDNRLTLDQSLDYLKLFEPENLRLELATGSHTLSNSQTIGTSAQLNTGVEWAGADGGTLINNTGATSLVLRHRNYLAQMNVPTNQSTALAWTAANPAAIWYGDIHPAITYNNSGSPVYYGGNFYTGNFTGGIPPVQQSIGGDRTVIDGTINIECSDFAATRAYFTANSQVKQYYRDNAACGNIKRAYLTTADDQVFFNGALNGVYTTGTTISTADYTNDLLNTGTGTAYLCGAVLDGGNAMSLISNRNGARSYFGCGSTGTNLAYGTALVWGQQGQGGIGFDGGTYTVSNVMNGTPYPYSIGGYATRLYGGTDASWPLAQFVLQSTTDCWHPLNPSLFTDSGNVNGSYSKPNYSTAANYWLYTYNRSNWFCTR